MEPAGEDVTPHRASLSLAAALACALAHSAAAEGPYRYAWVPIDAFDRNGKPVPDANGQQIHDGFCILWKTNWLVRNDHLPIIDGAVWWSGVSYAVDPRSATVTVYRVWGPDAVATAKGPRYFSREAIAYGVEVTAPLLDRPRADWPCTEATWATIMSGAREWSTQTIMPRTTYYYQRPCAPHCR
jgi:hypothetical protein